MNKTQDNAPTILVADDYENNRFLTANLLQRQGYRVIEAADGEQAVELALSKLPHLILMDIGMPRMDGLSALWRLRSEPELAEVPVVIVSAYDSYDLRAEATSAGCKGYLTKPIDADQLRTLVRAILQSSSRSKQLMRHLASDH